MLTKGIAGDSAVRRRDPMRRGRQFVPDPLMTFTVAPFPRSIWPLPFADQAGWPVLRQDETKHASLPPATLHVVLINA